MSDLSDFKRDKIIGVCMAGASLTKTDEFLGVARSTILKARTVFEKEGKSSSLKQNSWRKRKFFDWDCRTLTRIVRMNTASKITTQFRQKNGTAQSWISPEGCNQKTKLKLICLKFPAVSIILSNPRVCVCVCIS